MHLQRAPCRICGRPNPPWAMHACTQLHAPCTAAGGVDREGGRGKRPRGGHGGAAGGWVTGERVVACGPRGRGKMESESKSLKKLLLRDFYSFSPQQTFSPKKSPLFGFSVPKVPETYEKVPATKQGLSPSHDICRY